MMMNNKTIASFITLRLTKNKKFSILCLISLSLFICLSLPYTSHPIAAQLITSSSAPYTAKNNPLVLKEEQTTTIITNDDKNQPEEERYLAYLPHSGLSNQRIELANGLLLAHMLNRTLIIPPAFLGTVFGWMPREQLLQRLEWLTTPKNFNKLCQRPTPGKLASYVQRSQCEEYRHFGIIDWTELHDFKPLIDAGIKIKFQSTLSMTQITQDLNITASPDDYQIYVHDDMQLYDWRLYENKSEAIHLLENKLNYFDSFGGRRYYKVLLPRHFQQRKEKLLFLGGIFGSTRFTLVDPKHKAMQEKISQVLRYRLDTPIGETVKSIVNYLGGKGTFMSVHFRTGDSPFKKEISTNLENFVKNMTDIVGGYNNGNDTHVDECVNILYNTSSKPHIINAQYQNIMDEEKEENSLLAALGNRVKVYIATDHRDPRGEKSELLPWFNEFPCTTILNDLPEHLFRPLDELHDIISPSKSLRKYVIPLVDAMVAAHARRILTTPRSTFSKYIEELHNAWL